MHTDYRTLWIFAHAWLYTSVCHFVQARAAGKLAHLQNSATGTYNLINMCSANEDEEGSVNSLQSSMRVVCDMDTDGGGWIVIMRRQRIEHPGVNFFRSWDEYETGFGYLNADFWLGLRNIHCLTTRDDVDLIIDLRDHDYGAVGVRFIYHHFKVSGSDDKYRLQIGEAEERPEISGGEAIHTVNAMAYHNGKQFSTHDSDNDGNESYNCANERLGGWWYGPECFNTGAHLTGPHRDHLHWQRLLWYTGAGPGAGLGSYKYYRRVEMKIRPKTCASTCENL